MTARFITPGRVQGIDDTARRLLLVFATGDTLFTDDGRPIRYSFADGAPDLSILNSGAAPLRLDHRRTVDALIGVIEAAWVETGEHGPEGRCIARLSRSATGERVWNDACDGILTGASMGAEAHGAEISDAGAITCSAWCPVEVSLTASPRNRRAGIRSVGWEELAEETRRRRAIAQEFVLQIARKRLGADRWEAWADTVAGDMAARFDIDPVGAREFLATAVRNNLQGLITTDLQMGAQQ